MAMVETDELRVLVVEDDPMIMRLVLRMLEDEAGITATAGGDNVVVLMDTSLWGDVDVAVVDLLLPGTTGDEQLWWLEANAPHVRRIAMSGWGPDRLYDDAPVDARLRKPFMLDELLSVLQA